MSASGLYICIQGFAHLLYKYRNKGKREMETEMGNR